MRTQIPLGISLQDSATFANFCAGPNRAALAAVQSGREPCVYLWGARGSGRTVQDVNQLLREFRSMQRMMKQMTSGRGMAGLMSRFR